VDSPSRVIFANPPARTRALSASRVAGREPDRNRAAGPHPGQHRRAGITGGRHRPDIQGQGGKVQALTRRRTIRPSRPRRPDSTTRAHAANLPQKCSGAASSQASSSWLINGETTTIVTRPSSATGYAIVTPSSAQA